MLKYRFAFIGMTIGLTFWLIDAMEHWYFYGEPEFEFVPSIESELWSRIMICVAFTAIGFFVDNIYKKIAFNVEEKERIFKTTIIGAHHMLFNIINNVIRLKQSPEITKILSEEDLQKLDNELKRVASQMNKLEKLTDITEDNIRQIILHDTAD